MAECGVAPAEKSNMNRPVVPVTASASLPSQAQDDIFPSMRIMVLRRQVAVSQICTIPSSLPAASQLPSGATATAFTLWAFPGRAARCFSVAGSQIWIVPSLLPTASQLPSGATATAFTARTPMAEAILPPSSMAGESALLFRVNASQITARTVLDVMSPAVRVARLVPVAESQIRTEPSLLPVASQLPSGATAILYSASVRVARLLPVAGSQIRTIQSLMTAAGQKPSGATAIFRTRALPVADLFCWVRGTCSCLVSGSQIRIVLS